MPVPSRAFGFAAPEPASDNCHPSEQLVHLDEKARDLEALGDSDAVIECRIKQLALHRVLVHLYESPQQQLIRAQAVLAEAYASGGYFRQAHDHLARAREVTTGFEGPQRQRLKVDLYIAAGVVHLAEKHTDLAQQELLEAKKLGYAFYGDLDIRTARVHDMLGQIAQQREQHSDAIRHFNTVVEVYKCTHGESSERTVRLQLRIAEVRYASGDTEGALELQGEVVGRLQEINEHPSVLIDSAMQLAHWRDAQGRDGEALEALQVAEHTVTENFGPEDPKVVDIKRDVALLHLKLGDHETALQYLNDVHYLERRLHGSQSINVARTLKALGTVHFMRRNFGDAQQCLLQALRLFEADHPPNGAIIRDIHAKLGNIASILSNPD